MSLFIAGIAAGVFGTLIGLVVFDKFSPEPPPIASRWEIRGREVEVYEVVIDRVWVYENGLPNHYPLKYFMAAAKPVTEVKP